jgi:uncharacterized membrane protein
MAENARTQERANGGALGALWMVYGIARLLAAVVLVVYSGVVTLMFGALLTRVPNPFFLMNIFHFCYVVAIIVSVLAGLFGLLAGAALLARKASARGLSVVAGILSLSDVPLGTSLGTYTLILFLR